MDKTHFISYTNQDEKCAEWIAGVLEESGRSVEFQAWDIRGGSNFYLRMHEFLKKCDVFIAVFSQAYFESGYCAIEWSNFCTIAEKRKEKLFIPVRVTDVEPDGVFANTVYIDLYNIHDDKEREQKLLAGLEEAPRNKVSFPDTHLKPQKAFRSALPPNNLPERNLYFSGRENQLDEMRTMFRSGRAGCLKQTITGLGGIGKTQTALEYAWRTISEYKDAIWLFSAETEATMWSSCLGFAEAVGLMPDNIDETKELTPEQLVRLVNTWLAAHNSWLLILDNVEDIGVISPYISNVQSGHILITTRNNELKQGKQVGIELFSYDEAVQFMHDRLSGNAGLIDNESSLNELIDRMSYFPLALEQAGAYMESTGRSCSDYLMLLEKRGIPETLEARKSMPANYQLATAETLSLSINKLGVSARQLFNLCTYMSPDDIPMAFFERQTDRLPDPLRQDFGNEFKKDEIIAELLNYSLIKRDVGYFSINRLVQEIGRDQIKDDETSWPGICVEAIFEDLQAIDGYSNREQREQFTQIAAHGATIAGYAVVAFQDDDANEEKAAQLYYWLGKGELALARYDQAMKWFEKYLVVCEKVLGMEHMNTAATYTCIASVCISQGNYHKALEWHSKAMTIYESLLGKEHPYTATAYNNIAGVYDEQGEFPKAQEFYQKALVIREKVLGTEHPDTAKLYNNIAYIYFYQGDYPRALEGYLKATAITEKALGNKHPIIATMYNNIALAYSAQDNYAKAMEWNLKSLAIREEVLGTEHPDTAVSYNNIAGVYDKQGDYNRALEWYQKALAVREKVLGAEHPDTAVTNNNIALVYSNRGDYIKALEGYMKALVVYEKILGKEHLYTATTYSNIAYIYSRFGDYPRALEWYLKALAVMETVLGKDHPDTSATYDNVVNIKSKLSETM